MPNSRSRRRTVLVVDDDDTDLQALTLCLDGLNPSPWVLQAHDGKEASDQLAEHVVDLVITDLEMPVMDSFSFLARLANHRPRIPTVVVTAHGSEEKGKRLREHGIYRMVGKPFDFAAMQKLVADHLDDENHSVLNGFSLFSVLQLIEIERKSCTVRLTKSVLDSDVEGALYFTDGQLMDAASENHIGEDAVRELLSWQDPLIEIDRPAQVAEKLVQATITEFLVELARDQWAISPIDLSAIEGKPLKVGKHEIDARHGNLLDALRKLSGAVAAALFTWPEITLIAAAGDRENEDLELICRCAADALAVHARLEKVYGTSEREALFWLGRRFLLLHGIGNDHCAAIVADPELTAAQLLRHQLRALLPPPPKAAKDL